MRPVRRATIASAEPLTDTPTAQTRDVELPWGLVARVRAEEVMMPDGAAIAAERIHDGYILGNYHYLVERDSEAGRAFNRRIELRPTY